MGARLHCVNDMRLRSGAVLPVYAGGKDSWRAAVQSQRHERQQAARVDGVTRHLDAQQQQAL